MVYTANIQIKIRETLEGNPAIQAAYIHGSVAKGTARADSDLDIAILPKRGTSISAYEKLTFAAQLEAELGNTVDIGELSTRNLIYTKEVIHHGQEIFTKNRFESDLFLATALSMYVDLQEQRKEVIDAYSAK